METHVSTTPYIETNPSKIELEKEFIFAWRSFPALWDPRNQYYTNKYKRLEYLHKLLEVYQKIKPSATTDDVRKKINIFRSNYKRELNKIEESRKRDCSDVVYSPRVWYFPLLNFLTETKQSMKLPHNSFDSEEEVNTSREIENLNSDMMEETKTNITNVGEKSKIKEEIFEGHVCENYENISKRRRCENQDIQSSASDSWPMCLKMSEEFDCISSFFDGNNVTLSPDTLSVVSNTDYTSQNSMNLENDLSLSQLTIEEPDPLNIPPFFNLTPRLMPESPHYIIEEEFSLNPWAMLVATIFLTKTSGKTARPYIKSFFTDYPTPYQVLDETPSSLERFFENLGLKKRGNMIWKLSYQFVSGKWRRASDLCGIGKYGEDAYRIFCLGHTDVNPDDRYLKLYLDWLQCHTEFIKDSSVTDSENLLQDPVLKYYRITLKSNV